MLAFKLLDVKQRCFFAVSKNSDEIVISHLSSILSTETTQSYSNIDFSNTYFAFVDSSNGINPGWSLRLFLAALYDHSPSLAEVDLQIIGLRCSTNGSIGNSLIFTIKGTQVRLKIHTFPFILLYLFTISP
jgi:hypothetical protein